MFPWFAFGHISPFIQLSNQLSFHGVKISFISAPGNISRIRTALHCPDMVNIIPLSIPAVEGIPSGLESTAEMTDQMAELLKKALDAMEPRIKTLLSSLRPHIAIFDFTHQWIPSIASPFNIKTLFFSVFSPAAIACLVNPPVQSLEGPPPGFPPTSSAPYKTFEARNMSYAFKRFYGPSVSERAIACLKNSSSFIFKSCLEMEGPYVELIEAKFGKPAFLAGPLVPAPLPGELDRRLDEWLDRFSEKSVVLCSFGSETFLEDEQIRELVLGLEMTGAPFLVVLNFRVGEDRSARLRAALPEGFEERVQDRGVVHVGWVPQQRILAHSNVGCYVCHAGLSSVVEAIVCGCQLVLVPQKNDQFFNARLVGGDLKAGVLVEREDETGHFKKEDLSKAVEAVMKNVDQEPGRSIRENHGRWMQFLTGQNIQDKYTKDLVEKMEEMVFDSPT